MACGQTTCTARTGYSTPPLQQNWHTVSIKTKTNYSIQSILAILELERIQYKTDY